MTTSTIAVTGSDHRLDAHPSGGETTLYLVRHGRTNGNALRQLHGATDLPLDPLGLRQAERIADRLALEVRADALLTSPLARAYTTAEIIGRKMDLVPTIVPNLVEMNFGDLEGMTLEAVAENYPELALQALDIDDEELVWPNGESRRQFHTRVRDAFREILTNHTNRKVVVVAHGGVLGSLLAQIEGRSPNDWRAYQLANCSLTHVDFLARHTVVHFMNDSIHLDLLTSADGGDDE
ncbi:MAG TPA: histidine phosphatase family protein [Thermomicrobiales bacterium]